MGLAVMILSAWLIAASVIDLDNQWLPDVFTQGMHCGPGLIAAWVQQSPLTLQDAVTGVLVGFITYSLRWIAGIVLRKEALGMGDALLRRFRWLGGGVIMPNVALIASCCGLIYAVITKEDQPHRLCTVFKSGRYSNTFPQALF